jgi:hypothetical protein
MANEVFHLDWHGPFAIVDGADVPNLLTLKPDISRFPGVYVWTIPVGGEHWVHYVGKAEDQNGLLARLRAEFRLKDPKCGYVDDTALLLKGDRVPLYKPLTSKGLPDETKWQKDPDRFTACSNLYREVVRIFIAPMADSVDLIRFAEGALIHTIWDYETDNWGDRPEGSYYFLSNATNGPRRPTGAYRITMTFPVQIRGFEVVNGYTEPRAAY